MHTNPFMALALAEAEKAARAGEVPIGAVITDAGGQVIAVAHNLVESEHDPTAHAELLVIRKACAALQSPRLMHCSLYVTLEPCAMCAQAISLARIKGLYYGASDPKGGGVAHGGRIFHQPTCHHKPDIYDGIAAEACGNLLRTFFASKR